jgi:uncharacterized membrane protein
MNLIVTRTHSKEASICNLLLFNCALLLFRMMVTESIFYGFLIWNLVLAVVPYLLTYIMLANKSITSKKHLLLPFTAIWLLFLPNAPYIITDFLHLKIEAGMPEWFDILLLASFAFSGLLFGFLSIEAMHGIWQQKYNQKKASIFIFCCCLLSGVGIYLGRFLRYNSWDILINTVALLTDVMMRLLELKAIGFSVGYGLFVFLFYCFIKTHLSKS